MLSYDRNITVIFRFYNPLFIPHQYLIETCFALHNGWSFVKANSSWENSWTRHWVNLEKILISTLCLRRNGKIIIVLYSLKTVLYFCFKVVVKNLWYTYLPTRCYPRLHSWNSRLTNNGLNYGFMSEINWFYCIYIIKHYSILSGAI